ncbi:MAG TPA: hypothetical protein PLZ51_02155, partial [Aggregatilineales bacterium]|nr:hypothetical protein [Aggregatilineales bacterium]
NGIFSGIYEYDPGVVINPRAEIACGMVPPNAPAVMPFEFTGIPDEAVCSVVIVNIGEGKNNAELGRADDLIPVNGVVSGAIGILLGAGDVPQAEISCGAVSLPPAIAGIPYYFEGIPADATCQIIIIDEGNVEVIRFDVTQDENGLISGFYEYDPGVVPNPRAELACGLVGTPTAAIAYESTGHPTDAEFCDVVFYDINGQQVAVVGDLPDENGVVSGTYEYDPSQISIVTFEVVCALAGGSAEITPEATAQPEPYKMELGYIYCPIIEDVMYLDFMFYTDEATPMVFNISYVSGDYTESYVGGGNHANKTMYLRFPLGTGMTGGTVTIVGFDNPYVWTFYGDCAPEQLPPEITPEFTPEGTPDAEITPEGTPDAEITPEGTPDGTDYEVIANYICGDEDNNDVAEAVSFTVTITGNYPSQMRFELIVDGGSVIDEIKDITGDPINVAQFFEGGFTTGTLRVSDEGGNEWTFDADCTVKTVYGVFINKLWFGMPQENGGGLGAPALGSSVGPAENVDNFITATSSLGTVTCSWNGAMQTLLCSGTYADGFTLPFPNTGDMALLWVPIGEGYTVTETVPTGWENVYGLEWWQSCEQEGEVDGYKVCMHTVVNEYALPAIYLVNISKIFSDAYEVNNGGLNAPALGGGNYPTVDIDNLITATSSLGRAECDWVLATTSLQCLYFANVGEGGAEVQAADLLVPVGETYTVTEAPIEGWVTGYGVGTFSYEQCVANYSTGDGEFYNDFDIVGYCEHSVRNVVSNVETWMLVDIDKEWIPAFAFDKGLGAPAQGGYAEFAPDFDVPGMIVVTSEYGTMTCDWYAAFGGDFECRVNLTTRPFWYQYYDDLPVGPGGTYTVVENVPEGWTTVIGTGTFSLDTCPDPYLEYEDYTDENGEEQEIALVYCDHDVVNIQNETDLDGYYGVSIEKIWNDFEETASLGGLNSPVEGYDPVGPDTSYYPLIQVTSSLGVGNCYWYYWGNGASLDCYYDHYESSPIDPYDFLLVPVGESYTVTEVAIDGYINLSGLGTFDNNDCQFAGGVGGFYFEYDIPVCYHEVVNQEVEIEGYYQVQLDKYWEYGEYEGGLGAPAQGGGPFYGPLFDIPNMI